MHQALRLADEETRRAIELKCQEQIYAIKNNMDLVLWLKQLLMSSTEALDKEHMYYQNMRQAMLVRAKAIGCDFDKKRETWIDPAEFQGISEAHRDQLQAFIDERGLDTKAVCEHLGIDSLLQIEVSQIQAVQQEIDNLAKQGMTA